MTGQEKHAFKDMFPVVYQKFEGIDVPTPKNTEKYLKNLYGYIGADCRYDPKLMAYVKNDPADSSSEETKIEAET
eukprot:UN04216